MEKKEPASTEKSEDKKTLSSVFMNFASTTSAHGLLHVVNAKSLIVRLIWFAIWLAAWSMFFFMLGLLVRDYRRKPVSTTIKIKQEKELKFPSVMVCNHNMLKKSLITSSVQTAMTANTNSTDMTSAYATMAQEDMYGSMVTASPYGTGSGSGSGGGSGSGSGSGSGTGTGSWAATPTAIPMNDVDTDYVTSMNVLENLSNMNRKDLVNTGHSFSKFVAHCNWKGILCHKGVLKKYWTEQWNYMYGNCYVFNHGRTSNGTRLKPLHMNNVGTDNALILELDIEQNEYQEASNVESGVRVLLSDQEVFSLPVEEGFSVAPGVSASIAIRRYEIQRDDPFKNGTCKKERMGEEKLVYSVQRCSQLCRLKKQAAMCNCTSLKYASSHRTCFNASEKSCAMSVEKLYQNGTLNCDKECPQPCRETIYKYVTTSSQIFANGFLKAYNSRTPGGFGLQATYVKENFVRLKIFYEDQNVEYVITRAYYGIEKLLSDIGGQMGLWIGVSVVTIFELMGFLYNISVHLLRIRTKGVQQERLPEDKVIPLQ